MPLLVNIKNNCFDAVIPLSSRSKLIKTLLGLSCLINSMCRDDIDSPNKAILFASHLLKISTPIKSNTPSTIQSPCPFKNGFKLNK